MTVAQEEPIEAEAMPSKRVAEIVRLLFAIVSTPRAPAEE